MKYSVTGVLGCLCTTFKLLYNDIWYHIHDLKHEDNILAELFSYLLFYMKPNTVSIIISSI